MRISLGFRKDETNKINNINRMISRYLNLLTTNKRYTIISIILLIVISVIINIFYTSKKKNLKITPHQYYNYTLYEIDNILTPKECDIIIELGKARGVETSPVLSYGTESTTQINDKYRNSKHTWFNDNDHPIIKEIAEYTSKISGLPLENQEATQVAYYNAGGKFDAHYDACVYEDKSFCDKINNNAGQRKMTLLIYLNDDFEGGETEFTVLNLKIKPKKGKGILFYDTDDNQEIIKESMHKGNEIIKGEKWICTKWVHFKKFT